jgi:N-acetylmuramic acid 6-phosphate etherase
MPRKVRNQSSSLEDLATEQPNPHSADLDTKSALEIARIINSEDARVAAAVERALPQIAKAIDWIADALTNGGRLIYVGTGTSGRIAALDASECPPTFNTDPRLVQYVMAGGEKALGRAVEADEDSEELGIREIRKRKPGKEDVVVGIAASGRTPFTIAAIEQARRAGSRTIAVTCNVATPLEQAADHAIVVETGPEVVAGSTRMKAGTAEKMVLNMLSTGAMVRLGYVYGNLMVNLHQKNRKLAERAISIVEMALQVSRTAAQQALAIAKHDVPVAIVMNLTGASRMEALQALRSSGGHVRRAVERARGEK